MLMRRRHNYPVTVHFAENYPEKTESVFLTCRPHKGSFIGVAILDSVTDDLLQSVYGDLSVGEILTVSRCSDHFDRLNDVYVSREDGYILGKLPHCSALLPDVLMSRGIRVYAFLEAKSCGDFYAKLLVSVYAESY